MAELSADSRNRTSSNSDTIAKIYQLKRMAIILNRLRDGRSARPDELVEYVSREMELFDDNHSEKQRSPGGSERHLGDKIGTLEK